MNLNFKKTFFEILNLKYFWVYMLIFAVFSILSSEINAAKSIPNNNILSFIPLIFTYISLAFLAVMIHNIIHNKNLNDENESFKINFIKCLKVGVKALIAMGINTLIIMAVEFVLIFLVIVLFVVANPGLTQNEAMRTPLLLVLITFLTFSALIAIFFVFNLVFVEFANKYSIKDSFKWIKTLKTFLKQGFAKKTLIVLGIQILYQLFIFFIAIVIIYVHNYGTSLLLNYISENVDIINLLWNFIGKFIQLAISLMNFIIFAVVYNILANIYKESCEHTDLTLQTQTED